LALGPIIPTNFERRYGRGLEFLPIVGQRAGPTKASQQERKTTTEHQSAIIIADRNKAGRDRILGLFIDHLRASFFRNFSAIFNQRNRRRLVFAPSATSLSKERNGRKVREEPPPHSFSAPFPRHFRACAAAVVVRLESWERSPGPNEKFVHRIR
jgi:hypothetical protein